MLAHRNDGKKSPHLPAGTPFGLVGTSSLYKRESYPNGVVPAGSVTAVSAKPDDRKQQWRELAVSRFGIPGNWGEQGADAGLYENSDIWGIRILVLEPVSDVGLARSGATSRWAATPRSASASWASSPCASSRQGRQAAARSRRQPRHQLPGQGAGRRRLDVPDARQQRHGAEHGPDLAPGAARRGPQQLRRLPRPQPAADAVREDRRRQARLQDLGPDGEPAAVHHEGQRSLRPEVGQGRPHRRAASPRASRTSSSTATSSRSCERSCVACHSDEAGEAGRASWRSTTTARSSKRGLVPWAENVQVPQGLPRTYARLVQYSWAFQSRRSPLIWKVYGKRLDGFDNDDIASPPLDYDRREERARLVPPRQEQELRRGLHRQRHAAARSGRRHLQGAGRQAIKVPPLSDEDKLTLVRWIDIGCPIDRDYDPKQPERARPRLAARRGPADADAGLPAARREHRAADAHPDRHARLR